MKNEQELKQAKSAYLTLEAVIEKQFEGVKIIAIHDYTFFLVFYKDQLVASFNYEASAGLESNDISVRVINRKLFLSIDDADSLFNLISIFALYKGDFSMMMSNTNHQKKSVKEPELYLVSVLNTDDFERLNLETWTNVYFTRNDDETLKLDHCGHGITDAHLWTMDQIKKYGLEKFPRYLYTKAGLIDVNKKEKD